MNSKLLTYLFAVIALQLISVEARPHHAPPALAPHLSTLSPRNVRCCDIYAEFTVLHPGLVVPSTSMDSLSDASFASPPAAQAAPSPSPCPPCPKAELESSPTPPLELEAAPVPDPPAPQPVSAPPVQRSAKSVPTDDTVTHYAYAPVVHQARTLTFTPVAHAPPPPPPPVAAAAAAAATTTTTTTTTAACTPTPVAAAVAPSDPCCSNIVLDISPCTPQGSYSAGYQTTYAGTQSNQSPTPPAPSQIQISTADANNGSNSKNNTSSAYKAYQPPMTVSMAWIASVLLYAL